MASKNNMRLKLSDYQLNSVKGRRLLNTAQKQTNQTRKMQDTNMLAYIPQQNQLGDSEAIQPGKTGSTFSYVLNINNGEATAEEFIFSSENENGIIGIREGAVAPKVGVVITGTDDANSYTILGRYARVGMLVSEVHMTCTTGAGAASTAFFDSGAFVKLNAVDPSRKDGGATVPLSSLIDDRSQTTNIRIWHEGQGYPLTELSGYRVTIPAGIQVTFTFKYTLVGATTLMNTTS